MKLERLARGLVAVLIVGALNAPGVSPMLCDVSDHGSMDMTHTADLGAPAWAQPSHDGGVCHGSMGCIAQVVAVPAGGTELRELPAHLDISSFSLVSTVALARRPLIPPPRV